MACFRLYLLVALAVLPTVVAFNVNGNGVEPRLSERVKQIRKRRLCGGGKGGASQDCTPPPPPPLPEVQAEGDPHLKDGRGGHFDFKGKDLTVYNLLSTNNVTVNALFKHTDYYDAGINKRLVHGSFMTAAYVTTMISDGTVLQIEYDAARAVGIAIGVEGSLPTYHTSPMSISFQNVTISLKDRMATVKTSGWVITATSKFKKGIIRGNSCATGKCFLSVSIGPTFDTDVQREVSPHGLLGQAFDGSGKIPPLAAQ